MARPNGQNSELDPKKHPSGARIEKIMNNAQKEKGLYGETLRPSEREDKIVDDNHRRTPSTRET